MGDRNRPFRGRSAARQGSMERPGQAGSFTSRRSGGCPEFFRNNATGKSGTPANGRLDAGRDARKGAVGRDWTGAGRREAIAKGTITDAQGVPVSAEQVVGSRPAPKPIMFFTIIDDGRATARGQYIPNHGDSRSYRSRSSIFVARKGRLPIPLRESSESGSNLE